MRAVTVLCWTISLPAVAIATAILAGCPARADDASATAGRLSLTEVAASPAGPGGTTRISFNAENDGGERVVIVGLALPEGGSSRVVGVVGPGTVAEVGAVAVDPGDTLPLGERVWIEVDVGGSALAAGEHVPALLKTAVGDVPLTLHVTGTVERRAVSGPAVHSRLGRSSPTEGC